MHTYVIDRTGAVLYSEHIPVNNIVMEQENMVRVVHYVRPSQQKKLQKMAKVRKVTESEIIRQLIG